MLVQRDIGLEVVRRILLIKPSSIGDVVHTLPTLAALRRRFPDRHIAWLVEEEASGIVLDHPLLDRVLVSGRKRWRRALGRPSGAISALQEALAFMRQLQAERYDLAIDLQGLLKSGLLLLLSGARYRVGFAKTREGASLFLTHAVSYPEGLHAVERYLHLARFLGADGDPSEGFIPISPSDEDRIHRLLKEEGFDPEAPKVVLHADTRWRTKLWKEERFALLGDLLAERLRTRVLLTGSEAGVPLTRRIAGLMRSRPLNLAGRTDLKGLMALLKNADLMVTVDSGPMHIAAAFGTPLVALFGPTDPKLTGPYGGDPLIIRKDLPCSPCLKRRCQIQEERLCMRLIGVEEVFEAAIERYEKGRR